MTIKEITALRKAGRLDEAHEAAEQEFALCANNYTASALFWCLNEESKKETELAMLESQYERMKMLLEGYCPQSEPMQKSLDSLAKRLVPLGNRIREAVEQSRAGNINDELICEIQNAFDNGILNSSLYEDYGWLIYYTLKYTPLDNAAARKKLLHNYIRLDLPRPTLLHSRILSEAVKVEKNTPLQFRIRDFVRLWGWNSFREEDWQQNETDNGYIRSSLVEKLIAVYAKELKTDGVASSEEFDNVVDSALECYPNSQYMPLYKAIALMSKGQDQQALDYYKMLILKSPTKGYLWHQASELVDDVDTRISLLCKAIDVEKNESFKGNCRLGLAKALIEKGLMTNAKKELSIYSNFYRSKGWSLSLDYLEIESRIQDQVEEASDNELLYKEYISLAESFIYSSIPSIPVIKEDERLVDDRHRPGRRFKQWILRKKDGVLYLKNPQKFGLDCHSPNGAIFEVKLYNNRIVWIKKSVQNSLHLEWVKIIEGAIKIRSDRNGRAYAILDGAYIGYKLLNGITDMQTVKIVAIKQEDGRWKAISLKKV